MHRLKLRDALSAPGLMSLSRIPMAVAFAFTVDIPIAALGLLAASGLSDVLDGWWARRTGQTSFTGAVLDGVVDKVFVLAVVLGLLAHAKLSLVAVLVLGARDVVLFPLAFWLIVDKEALTRHTEQVHANQLGKAVTVLQYATVVAALVLPSVVMVLVVLSGTLGAIAGAGYWVQMIRSGTARNAP